MKFFVDTANVETIRNLNSLGLIDGVTTNPSLIAKEKGPFAQTVASICEVIDGPVSAEVLATEADQMLSEGKQLASIAQNVVVKLPLNMDGLATCRALSEAGIKTNVTLCFSANQALLAAKAGATYISPFIGRLDDTHIDGLDLIQEIRTIYDNFDFSTSILAASLRGANHVKQCAIIGADVATIPPKIIPSLLEHPLTSKGLEQFLKDAEAGNVSV